MADTALPTNIVPPPPASQVSGCKRVIDRLGGVVHQAPHADRVSRTVNADGSLGKPEELCTCNQVALADVPQPGMKPAVRICIVCDSAQRWPRILREAAR